MGETAAVTSSTAPTTIRRSHCPGIGPVLEERLVVERDDQPEGEQYDTEERRRPLRRARVGAAGQHQYSHRQFGESRERRHTEAGHLGVRERQVREAVPARARPTPPSTTSKMPATTATSCDRLQEARRTSRTTAPS